MWNFISNVGLNKSQAEKYRNHIIIANRINLFVIIIYTAILVVDYLSEEPIWDNIGILILCFVHLFLNHSGHFRTSRVLMMIDLPVFLIGTDIATSEITTGGYFWLPYIPIGLALVPFLVFSLEKDLKIIISVVFLYFILTFSMNELIDFFIPEATMSPIAKRSEPFYSMGPSLLFIFVILTVYYALKVSLDSEVKLSDAYSKLSKSHEELAAKNTELEDLINTKDKFFRIIGHDLTAPMAQMIQISKHIGDAVDELSEEEIKGFMQNQHKSSLRGLRLLENLLEWARSQTGNISFNPKRLNLSEICTNVKDLLNSSAENKGITLNLSISKEAEIDGDYNMLHTIIRNLVSNAIKYTTHGGHIKISSEYDGGNCYVMVEDTGVGMDEQTINRLLKIESVESHPGTNNEKGTGIGLILCNEFIKRHEGSIHIRSTVNEGSCFTIGVPRRNLQERVAAT